MSKVNIHIIHINCNIGSTMNLYLQTLIQKYDFYKKCMNFWITFHLLIS
jgi:hypothetical protein